MTCAAGVNPFVRDLDTIDSELRLLAAVRWSIREHGAEPSSRQVDELLDRSPAAGATSTHEPGETRCVTASSLSRLQGRWR